MQISWLGVSDNETNFMLATFGGNLYENVIIKEADLKQKVK